MAHAQHLADEEGRLQEQRFAARVRGENTSALDARLDQLARKRRRGPVLKTRDTVGGRFVLLEHLGRGGFGTVWRADDTTRPQSQSTVALKVLHPHLTQDQTARARFERGAQVMLQLKHQHVVRIIEPVQEWEGFRFLVMQYVPGGDLGTAAGQTRLPVIEALELLRQVCEALIYTHGEGGVHGDVKPSNVLYTDPPLRAFVTDFDLFRWHGQTSTRHRPMGSAIFAAPETLFGRPTQRSDVYSFAVMTCIVLASGHHEQQIDSTALVRSANPPRALLVPLLEALTRNPHSRPADLKPMLAGLISAINDTTRSWPDPAPPPDRRELWLVRRWINALDAEEWQEISETQGAKGQDIRSLWSTEVRGLDDTPDVRARFAEALIRRGTFDPLQPLVDTAVESGRVSQITLPRHTERNWTSRAEALFALDLWQITDIAIWLNLDQDLPEHLLAPGERAAALLQLVHTQELEDLLDGYLDNGLDETPRHRRGGVHATRLSDLFRSAVVFGLIKGTLDGPFDTASTLGAFPSASGLFNELRAEVSSGGAHTADLLAAYRAARDAEHPVSSQALLNWTPEASACIAAMTEAEFIAYSHAFIPRELRMNARSEPLHACRQHAASLLSQVPWAEMAGRQALLARVDAPLPMPWPGHSAGEQDMAAYRQVDRMISGLSADHLDALIADLGISSRYLPPRQAGTQRRTNVLLTILANHWTEDVMPRLQNAIGRARDTSR